MMFSILSDIAAVAIAANLVHRLVSGDGGTFLGNYTGWAMRLSFAVSTVTVSLFVLAWFRVVPREPGITVAMTMRAIQSVFAMFWRFRSKSQRQKVATTQKGT